MNREDRAAASFDKLIASARQSQLQEQPQSLPQSLPQLLYGKVPDEPTQKAVEGIRFDFNDGIRIKFPNDGYRVCFSDLDTGIILYNSDVAAGAMVSSVNKSFVRFRLQIFRKTENTPIFEHDYNAENKPVMIQLPMNTLDNVNGWLSYVECFRQKHKCQVLCVMMPWIYVLFRESYPQIKFITRDETLNYSPYACYRLVPFFNGGAEHQPSDSGHIGLHHSAGCILGGSQPIFRSIYSKAV